MQSIPASQFAAVIPGVLSAGGNPLSANSVYLTSDPSIPIGTVQPFASYDDVAAWFGASAPEAIVAAVYFAGYTGCTTLPSVLYFAQFNTASVGAYLRGASVAALSLAQLQALSGTIALEIDGVPQTSSAINLSSATGPSNAASLITTGLQSSTAIFNGTGSQAAGVVTISATTSGQLAVGVVLEGAGVDGPATITSFGTYTVLSGTGTVNVSTSATVSSGAVTAAGTGTATYDSLRDAFVISSGTTGATSSVTFPAANSLTSGLNLTAATGAVISPGAAAVAPATLMNSIKNVTQNWVSFMTVVEQILSVKEAFAAWVQTTGRRFAYVCQDSDATALTADATGCFGNIVNAANDDGIMPIYDNSGQSVIAALQTAIAASINYNQEDGRTTWAFRNQAGLAAQIGNQTQYQNLIGNGYSCYVSIATANQEFVQNQNGQISGVFKWADSYFGQIQMNAAFQLALLNMQTTVPATPYVTRGYNYIRNALLTPITQFKNFGLIVSGVTLSGTQAAALNSATGDPNATATIQNTGWYLQILDPGSIVRGNRGTPVISFWYTDGGSVQQISMSSTDVQ
jgi:hypothetical protein